MQKTALEHDLQKLVEKALALGASGAKTVDVASIYQRDYHSVHFSFEWGGG